VRGLVEIDVDLFEAFVSLAFGVSRIRAFVCGRQLHCTWSVNGVSSARGQRRRCATTSTSPRPRSWLPMIGSYESVEADDLGLQGRVVLHHEAQDGHEQQQQRKQRQEPVVGDERAVR
jgi:hypothetical protein